MKPGGFITGLTKASSFTLGVEQRVKCLLLYTRMIGNTVILFPSITSWFLNFLRLAWFHSTCL